MFGSIELNYTFYIRKMAEDLCRKLQFSWMMEI